MATKNPPSQESDMTEVATQSLEAFVQTGRTGRRNALSDILNDGAGVSTADLPFKLEALSCKDDIPEEEKASMACGDPFNKTQNPEATQSGEKKDKKKTT